jgi:pimeloyl-ACP methyl ester carboxylesterase
VVLLHGLGGTWEYWYPVVQRALRECTFVAVDLPGFGDSERCEPQFEVADAACLVDEALAELGLAEVTLIGHSLGGAIAVELAARGRARALGLLAPAGFGRVPIERLVRLIGIQTAALRHLDRWERLPARRRWARRATLLTLAPDAGRFTADEAVLLLRGAARATQLAEAAYAIARTDVSATAAMLELPVLLAWGARDAVVPRRAAGRVLAAVPHARLVVWPGLGHKPMLERPDLVVEAIRTLLPVERRLL